MKTRIAFAFALLIGLSGVASAQTTYVVGNWSVNARQDKGIKWLFNQQNNGLLDSALSAGTAINAAGSGYKVNDVVTVVDNGTCSATATLKVTSVDGVGGVLGLQVLTYGSCTTRQGAANHQTTGAPVGGTGLVVRVNYYRDVPDMLTRNGGILDSAVNSYAAQREAQLKTAVSNALESATTTQLNQALAALGVVDPR